MRPCPPLLAIFLFLPLLFLPGLVQGVLVGGGGEGEEERVVVVVVVVGRTSSNLELKSKHFIGFFPKQNLERTLLFVRQTSMFSVPLNLFFVEPLPCF